MAKKIFFIIALLILLLISFGAYVFLNRASLLSSILSTAIEVPVKINAIDISKQGIVIRELSIQNPPECYMKTALTTKSITVQLNWMKLMKALIGLSPGNIVIDSLAIDHSKMGVELFTITGSDNNWTRIFNTTASAPSEPSTLKFQIKDLTLTSVNIEANYHDLSKISPPQPVQIQKIELKDIGNDKDIDMKQIFLIVSKILIENAAKQFNLNGMLQQMLLERVIPLPFIEVDVAKSFLDKFFQDNSSNTNNSNNTNGQ